MSFRQRIATPSDRAIEDYELRQMYRRVFSGADGERVLDHIVQQVCGVDAIIKYSTDVQAFVALERKNVGLMIARLALETPNQDSKIEVKT